MNSHQLLSFTAVGLGAALGAWARWGAGLLLNAVVPNLPLGTLLVNLVGGLLIGMMIGFAELGLFEQTHIRLLIVTGFLGGLTTFSTFSGEGLLLLQKHAYGWALLHMSSHVFGALLMAALGFALVQLFK